jgi:2'-5' RNA ligase
MHTFLHTDKNVMGKYTPHMTVTFKDLTEDNFKRAWKKYKHEKICFRFQADKLTLLKHNGENWVIKDHFELTEKT